jgi:hypothetical protein
MTGNGDHSDARWDEYKVQGEELLAKVKELVHEGNIRRVVIENDGRTILEIPLTLGVVGALILPMAAAIGAVAAVVTDCVIRVERIDEPE